jgi:hypothetical protein
VSFDRGGEEGDERGNRIEGGRTKSYIQRKRAGKWRVFGCVWSQRSIKVGLDSRCFKY